MSASHAEHDHHDDGHPPRVYQHDVPLPERAKRFLALKELLIEKGVVTQEEIRHEIDAKEARSPRDGARVVARAWADPAFKARLLRNPRAAIAEMGYGEGMPAELVVVENTEKVRNLTVCTLCSCYPSWLLGRPPDWYKSFAYRSRAVSDPRGVMREFGLAVPQDVQVRVVDSTSETRYLVLPQRPSDTEGMSEEQLATLVTRDSMIGVADPLSPQHTKG